MKSVSRLLVVLFGFFLLSSINTFAQKAVFSGNWMHNAGKSTMPEGYMWASAQLKVAQTNLALDVQRIAPGPNGQDFSFKEIISLDGKESVNVIFGEQTRQAVATWSADSSKLTIAYSMTFEMDGESKTFKTTEIWSIAADASALTLETTSATPNGNVQAMLVYEKAK